ncbi:MAG: gamma-glutamylcyclotransferase [Polaromonas sp.]|nr:gamma-glutamylcyclotransferase [Polaromonas sp.]
MASTITDTRRPQVLRYVFVYGTLRKGEERDINRLQPAPVFVGDSQIKGTLYDLGSYPGVRLSGENWVQGEVYQITPELERQLDEIEEVWPQQTGEYVKREVVVQCAGLALVCLVYVVAELHVQGRGVIESGDWGRRYGE